MPLTTTIVITTTTSVSCSHTHMFLVYDSARCAPTPLTHVTVAVIPITGTLRSEITAIPLRQQIGGENVARDEQ